MRNCDIQTACHNLFQRKGMRVTDKYLDIKLLDIYINYTKIKWLLLD